MEESTHMSTAHKATLSLAANYRGLSAALAVNPGNLSGKDKDFELNLNAFANRYGIDVVYQAAKSLTGKSVFNGESFHLDKGMIDMKMLNVNGYYAFNYRRFSYPAAFNQSYIQKHSAGSWLVGFSFMGGRMKTTASKPENTPLLRTYVGHFGVGGGYAYNLVLYQKWLLHLSFLPSIVVANRNNVEIDGDKRYMKTSFPDMIFVERAAVVRDFGSCFVGCTFSMSNSLLYNNLIDIDYRKWRLRLCMGFRI